MATPIDRDLVPTPFSNKPCQCLGVSRKRSGSQAWAFDVPIPSFVFVTSDVLCSMVAIVYGDGR